MPLLQFYVQPHAVQDLYVAMRSLVESTSRTLWCVAAFLTSISVLPHGPQAALSIQPAATQYLLGLGM